MRRRRVRLAEPGINQARFITQAVRSSSHRPRFIGHFWLLAPGEHNGDVRVPESRLSGALRPCRLRGSESAMIYYVALPFTRGQGGLAPGQPDRMSERSCRHPARGGHIPGRSALLVAIGWKVPLGRLGARARPSWVAHYMYGYIQPICGMSCAVAERPSRFGAPHDPTSNVPRKYLGCRTVPTNRPAHHSVDGADACPGVRRRLP